MCLGVSQSIMQLCMPCLPWLNSDTPPPLASSSVGEVAQSIIKTILVLDENFARSSRHKEQRREIARKFASQKECILRLPLADQIDQLKTLAVQY